MERRKQVPFSKNQARFLHALTERPGGERFTQSTVGELYSAIGTLGDGDDGRIAAAYLAGTSQTKIAQLHEYTTGEVKKAIIRVLDALTSSNVQLIDEEPSPVESLVASIGSLAVAAVEEATSMPCKSDPELFFRKDNDSVEKARALCFRCTVREDCLEEGFKYDMSAPGPQQEYGMWGGFTAEERAEFLRRAKREGRRR